MNIADAIDELTATQEKLRVSEMAQEHLERELARIKAHNSDLADKFKEFLAKGKLDCDSVENFLIDVSVWHNMLYGRDEEADNKLFEIFKRY